MTRFLLGFGIGLSLYLIPGLLKRFFFVLGLVLQARRSFGVVVEDHFDGKTVIFWGSTPDARKVVKRHCRHYPVYFGGYRVPLDERRRIYEEISHDAKNPQAMVSRARLLGAGVTIIDT